MKLCSKHSHLKNLFVAAVAFGVVYGSQTLWAASHCVASCSEGCFAHPRWCWIYNTGAKTSYQYLIGGVQKNVAINNPSDQCVETPDGGSPNLNNTFVMEKYDKCGEDCPLKAGEAKVFTTGAILGTKFDTVTDLVMKTKCVASSE